jgi:flagellar basal body rod protein FlgG
VLEEAGGATGCASLNQAINNYGMLSGTTLDETQGALQKTGNDLDVAIQGPGFFVVKTAAGEMYTRNGSLQVSGKGQLVTAAGDPVLGPKGPISLPPGSVSISPDGTISSNGAVAGQLKLLSFPRGRSSPAPGETTTPRRRILRRPRPIPLCSRECSKAPTSTRSASMVELIPRSDRRR